MQKDTVHIFPFHEYTYTLWEQMGSFQFDSGEISKETWRIDLKLKSMYCVFCSGVKWISYYLVPRYYSNCTVRRCHYIVILSDNHLSKRWQLHRSYFSLANTEEFINMYSMTLSSLLVNLHLQMHGGWWGWNASLVKAHNGPKSECVAETANQS